MRRIVGLGSSGSGRAICSCVKEGESCERSWRTRDCIEAQQPWKQLDLCFSFLLLGVVMALERF